MKDSPMKKDYYEMRRKQALRFNHTRRGGGNHQHPPKFWTHDEDVIILKQQDSDVKIAHVLARSVASVRSRRTRLRHDERFQRIYGEYINKKFQTHQEPQYTYQENKAIVERSKMLKNIAYQRGVSVQAIVNHRRKLLARDPYWIQYAREHGIKLVNKKF